MSARTSLQIEDDMPPIPPDDIPADQLSSANAVYGCLRELQSFIKEFIADLDLLQVSEANVNEVIRTKDERDFGSEPHFTRDLFRFVSWSDIAKRDAIMNIYHFGVLLDAITFGGCPAWGKVVNTSELRIARKLFASQFPDFEDARHAVAHLAELTSTPEGCMKTAAREGFEKTVIENQSKTPIIVKNVSAGRTYSNTINGKVVSTDVDDAALEKLRLILTRVFKAFPRH